MSGKKQHRVTGPTGEIVPKQAAEKTATPSIEPERRQLTGPTGELPEKKPVAYEDAPDEVPEDGDIVVSLEGEEPLEALRRMLRQNDG